jgi:hypothetical protein
LVNVLYEGERRRLCLRIYVYDGRARKKERQMDVPIKLILCMVKSEPVLLLGVQMSLPPPFIGGIREGTAS